jgi:hypothetical protein
LWHEQEKKQVDNFGPFVFARSLRRGNPGVLLLNSWIAALRSQRRTTNEKNVLIIPFLFTWRLNRQAKTKPKNRLLERF